jgi:hypothetical protein
MDHPFRFELRNHRIDFKRNFPNKAGCQWQGLGGTVYDRNGKPLRGVQVYVFSGEHKVAQSTVSGTKSRYDLVSGWEIQVDTVVSNKVYFVELHSKVGLVISPRVEVTFPGTCEGNLAVINFVEKALPAPKLD